MTGGRGDPRAGVGGMPPPGMTCPCPCGWARAAARAVAPGIKVMAGRGQSDAMPGEPGLDPPGEPDPQVCMASAAGARALRKHRPRCKPMPTTWRTTAGSRCSTHRARRTVLQLWLYRAGQPCRSRHRAVVLRLCGHAYLCPGRHGTQRLCARIRGRAGPLATHAAALKHHGRPRPTHCRGAAPPQVVATAPQATC